MRSGVLAPIPVGHCIMGQVEPGYAAEQPKRAPREGTFQTHGCLLPQPGQASGSSGPPRCWPRTQGGQASMPGIGEFVLRRLENGAEAAPQGLRA